MAYKIIMQAFTQVVTSVVNQIHSAFFSKSSSTIYRSQNRNC